MQEILKHIPLFSELDAGELASIYKLITINDVAKKTVVLHEGEEGGSLFIIIEGSVKISYYAPDGREIVLSLLEEGAYFGEMSLLDKQPRSATVSTLTNSKLAQIRSVNFERLLLKQPKVALKLLAETVNRLRRTSQLLERVSTMDVPHRLYFYLKDFGDRFGKVDSDGVIIVKLPTHQMIADQLSTSRETISRAASALKKEGIIGKTDNPGESKIDMDALETLLQAIY
ncbi:MAG: Crp/Fnr family transcriptional regulator [Zetaproteobacteria bacterium]|nr:MAG: Crp/Fnr family transcriptional regulator [Zetaproteobacteria bacterium]